MKIRVLITVEKKKTVERKNNFPAGLRFYSSTHVSVYVVDSANIRISPSCCTQICWSDAHTFVGRMHTFLGRMYTFGYRSTHTDVRLSPGRALRLEQARGPSAAAT